jgi:hypothetical protein
LLEALTDIAPIGAFHVEGDDEFFPPQLFVEGFGKVPLPLTTAAAKTLIALAEPAPHGQGTKTVLDESIRKCRQIDASRFSLKSPDWMKYLERVTRHITRELGISCKVVAEPYKLLVYEPGGHFKPHRDTEKLDAMFGSLILSLPSSHTGGQLFIRHDGREHQVDFSRPGHDEEFRYAAFFADCEHEVKPVKSGYRCCLAYNLCLKDGDASQLNMTVSKYATALATPVHRLLKEIDHEESITVVLLSHSYTQANLAVKNLKGADQSQALALFAAAKQAGGNAYLCLLTLKQSGEMKFFDHDDYDEAAGTMGKIHEEVFTLSDFRDADDQPLDEEPFETSPNGLNIISKTPLCDNAPDDQEAGEYTGNAGCTLEYFYRRAVIVIRPGRED